MFFIDDNNNIKLTRSDTAVFELTIVDADGNTYDYSDDLVQLTIKGSVYNPNIIIQKNIDVNSFKLMPNDTKNLEYGVYKYDVQIINGNNDVFTVIGPCDFELTSEVNFNVER